MAKYQYGTSPRKLEPDFIPNRAAVLLKKKIVVYIGIAFAMLLVISYRNSLITEDFNKVKNLKADLATLQKENQQTQVLIESNLNL